MCPYSVYYITDCIHTNILVQLAPAKCRSYTDYRFTDRACSFEEEPMQSHAAAAFALGQCSRSSLSNNMAVTSAGALQDMTEDYAAYVNLDMHGEVTLNLCLFDLYLGFVGLFKQSVKNRLFVYDFCEETSVFFTYTNFAKSKLVTQLAELMNKCLNIYNLFSR